MPPASIPPNNATANRPRPVLINEPADHSADAVWRLLCAGYDEAWLDDVWSLRTSGDDLETSMDIWSVALIAALKQPERQETASDILGRLRKITDEDESPSIG